VSDVAKPLSKRSTYTISILVALAVLVLWCLLSLPGQVAEIMHRLSALPAPSDVGSKLNGSYQRGEIEGEATGGNLVKGLIVYGLLMLWLIPIRKKKVRRPWLMALLFMAIGLGVGFAAGPMAESKLSAAHGTAPAPATP
jgi:hypothetical protein